MAFILESDTIVQEDLTPINYNIGTPGHECNMAPFMLESKDSEIVEEHPLTIEEKFNILGNALPEDVKKIYRTVKSSSQEIYIKDWTLFSLDNIIKLFLDHRDDNINVTDIGLKYCGMGHCKIAFYDPATNMIYYRHDGGSNGFDREERFEALKAYKSDEKNAGLNFETFMKQINEELEETYCLF